MEQVLEFFQKLFDTSDWPPRWHCGNWTDFHGWLYIISDLLIWSAYFAIPLAILRFISRRVDARFIRTYFLFAAFILACGSTHLLDAVTFWFPAYRLNALVRFVTGVVSWVTVFHIIRIMPIAMALPTHAAMEKEINERRRVEEDLKVANNQLTVAQEIAKVGHWEWDVPGNVITWSRELYKIVDLKEGTPLTYDTFLHYTHPDDREFVQQNIERALAEKQFPNFVYRARLDDGTVKVLQSRGEVITASGGEVVRMIGTAQDVTDQQRAQQQMVERTHELELTNAELQKFAYVASHDLQEPLRKIMTFSSLLEREVGEGMSEKGKVYMDKVVLAAGRMQRLIDDILKFSSLRVTRQDYQPVDLNAVLQQVRSDLEVKIEAAQANVTVPSDLPTVEAIPSQMQQLFQNLLSNALKFNREGQRPEVSVTAERLTAAQLRDLAFNTNSLLRAGYNWGREPFVKIEVRDNGIGFDANYAGKIFEIFQRLHGARNYEGTGIGLAIVKKIVDNHNGVIHASSQPGQGAVFTILLPLSQKNFFVE